MAEEAEKKFKEVGDKNQTKETQPKKSNTCCICGVIAAVLIVIVVIIGVFVLRFVGPFWTGSQNDTNVALESATENQNAKPEITDQQLLDYFTSITFTAAGKNNQLCVAERWPNKTVTISVSGEYNDEAIKDIDNVINKFNAISTTTKLSRVSSSGLMQIAFKPHDVVVAEGRKVNENIFGWARPNPNNDCQIQSAQVEISTRTLETALGTNSVIVHEIGHALGFIGHDFGQRGCNALTNVACGPMETYSQYDISAIKMLYNSGLPFCATKAQAESIFANDVPR